MKRTTKVAVLLTLTVVLASFSSCVRQYGCPGSFSKVDSKYQRVVGI